MSEMYPSLINFIQERISEFTDKHPYTGVSWATTIPDNDIWLHVFDIRDKGHGPSKLVINNDRRYLDILIDFDNVLEESFDDLVEMRKTFPIKDTDDGVNSKQKAFIVLELDEFPSSCNSCDFRNICPYFVHFNHELKPHDCPARKYPELRDTSDRGRGEPDYNLGVSMGWNEAVDTLINGKRGRHV